MRCLKSPRVYILVISTKDAVGFTKNFFRNRLGQTGPSPEPWTSDVNSIGLNSPSQPFQVSCAAIAQPLIKICHQTLQISRPSIWGISREVTREWHTRWDAKSRGFAHHSKWRVCNDRHQNCYSGNYYSGDVMFSSAVFKIQRKLYLPFQKIRMPIKRVMPLPPKLAGQWSCK